MISAMHATMRSHNRLRHSFPPSCRRLAYHDEHGWCSRIYRPPVLFAATSFPGLRQLPIALSDRPAISRYVVVLLGSCPGRYPLQDPEAELRTDDCMTAPLDNLS